MVLAALFTVFAVVAFPALVIMVIWTVITALRILRPEHPLPLFAEPVARRQETPETPERATAVPVGFREIHDGLRLHAQRLTLPYQYHATVGGTHHVPEPWIEDLDRRRN